MFTVMRFVKVKFELRHPVVMCTRSDQFDDFVDFLSSLDDCVYLDEISEKEAVDYAKFMGYEARTFAKCGLYTEAEKYSSCGYIRIMSYDSHFDGFVLSDYYKGV